IDAHRGGQGFVVVLIVEPEQLGPGLGGDDAKAQQPCADEKEPLRVHATSVPRREHIADLYSFMAGRVSGGPITHIDGCSNRTPSTRTRARQPSGDGRSWMTTQNRRFNGSLIDADLRSGRFSSSDANAPRIRPTPCPCT